MIRGYIIVDKGSGIYEAVLHQWTNRNPGNMVLSIGPLYWGVGYHGAYWFSDLSKAYTVLRELIELERHLSKVYLIETVFTFLTPVENRLGWDHPMPKQE